MVAIAIATIPAAGVDAAACATAANALIIARYRLLDLEEPLSRALEGAADQLGADRRLMRAAVASAGREWVRSGRRITRDELGQVLHAAMRLLLLPVAGGAR